MTNIITDNDVEALARLAPHLLDTYEQGAIILVSDKDTIKAKYHSPEFDISAFQVGDSIAKNDWMNQCLQRRQASIIDLARSAYGLRLQVRVFPVFNAANEQELVGTLSILLPAEPVLARAFSDFAPMLAEMFPEGAFIYMTGRNHISHRQASQKFNLLDMELRSPIKEGDIASETLKTQKPVTRELDADVYGVPTLMLSYPIFEVDNSGKEKISGTFGIALPKIASYKLREMADNLNQAMQRVGEVVQQLANSASQVAVNSQKTDQDMAEIYSISEQINEVMGFIKRIAEETKMLGLNAAIEAARAGELGRGFGVVAEEIRKLSDESRDTVMEIRNLTQAIKDKLTEGTASSNIMLRSSEEQAAGTQELNASVEEILALIQEIDNIARIV